MTDAAGNQWYPFNGTYDSAAPGGWNGSRSTHTASLKMRSYLRGANHPSGGFDPNLDTPLYTFEHTQAAFTCYQNHISNGVLDVINNCSRGVSNPVITITSTCGTRGNPCCWQYPLTNAQGSPCDSGSACTDKMVCGTCGDDAEETCNSVDAAGKWFTYCHSGLRQRSDTFLCGACGGNGQVTCLSPPFCNAGFGHRAGSSTCEPCGGAGQIMCDVPPFCASGVADANGFCQGAPPAPPPPSHSPPPPPRCGNWGEPCCSGTCNAGQYCQVNNMCDPNPPGPCNFVGEACCTGEYTSTSSCSNTYDPLIKTTDCIGSCSH